jgi:exodeoxyribonuclease V alpha subunit
VEWLLTIPWNGRSASVECAPWTWIDEDKAVPWVEKRGGLKLADSQRAAIRLALMAKALVITGGPGVGKTTIVKSILQILAAKDVKLLLCAPTGRAAKRMTEATGVEAKTIHRLLEVDLRAAVSNATPTIPSIAICWSSTRPPWSTSC